MINGADKYILPNGDYEAALARLEMPNASTINMSTVPVPDVIVAPATKKQSMKSSKAGKPTSMK